MADTYARLAALQHLHQSEVTPFGRPGAGLPGAPLYGGLSANGPIYGEGIPVYVVTPPTPPPPSPPVEEIDESETSVSKGRREESNGLAFMTFVTALAALVVGGYYYLKKRRQRREEQENQFRRLEDKVRRRLRSRARSEDYSSVTSDSDSRRGSRRRRRRPSEYGVAGFMLV